MRNKTGIDASVTSYGPKGPPKQVKDYHVVIITKLPFFKQPHHSEDDTVQFMVGKMLLLLARACETSPKNAINCGKEFL